MRVLEGGLERSWTKLSESVMDRARMISAGDFIRCNQCRTVKNNTSFHANYEISIFVGSYYLQNPLSEDNANV